MKKIFSLLAIISIIGCKNKSDNFAVASESISVSYKDKTSQVANYDTVAVVDSAAAAVDLSLPDPKTESSEIVAPKIIKNADLSFQTSDIEQTNTSILEICKKTKAIIQNDSEGKNESSIYKNLTIRIPNENFDAFISELSKGVNYFDRKDISSQDVTEEYIDVASRIKTKKVLEERYLQLLQKAGKVSEMLEVEKQLSQIREEIEAKEGRLKYLQNKVAMSTINIEFYKPLAQETGATVSYGTKIVNAIKSGFNSISSFFIGLLENWPIISILAVIFIYLKKKLKKEVGFLPKKQMKNRMKLFKKRYILTTFAAGFLFVGVSFKDDFFEIAKQIEIFTTLFKTVNQNYVDQTNPAELMDKAIKSMLVDLDPYTNFFNEADVIKFKINNTGEYTGIGAMITRKEDKLIVKEPYKGYPADKAGLKAGDEIIQIGDVKLSDYKDDASQLLKGTKNTKINLTFLRQGKTNTAEIVIDEIDIKAVPFFSKIDEKTGYIVLEKFNNKASHDTKEALEKLKEQGAERIILDLRGNPGGLLHEAVNICNLFVPKGEIIVTTKSKNEKYNDTYKTLKEPIDTEIPLVIIVDGKSASASEIVAGALQDLDRAVVVGSRSYGKGLVQRPFDMTYGTQVKVTISRYYTPSGRCIQALDYLHKDKDGKAVRTEASKYNAFKTKAGRTVYDGGGIQPDLEIEETKSSTIAQALQKNDGIFNYVTNYCYKNPTLGDKIPVITDADFLDFKNFLKKEKINFDTETELALKNTLEKAKKELIDASISVQYDQLMTALQKSEDLLVDKNQKEIKRLILDEIIKRYQYKEGLYQYYTKSNSEISKAVTILANSNEYNKILKK